jgi:RimJ/RimL family protein N-acetyltransferase
MTKRHIPALQSNQVRLRLLSEADISMTRLWRNQDHIRKWFFCSDLITPEQQCAWYEQYKDRDDDFVFIIEDVNASRRPVGQVALYHIDWNKREAEYGRLMIGEPDATGKGFARTATHLVLQIAFVHLRLELVYLEFIANNSKAFGMYQSVGFHITQTRENVYHMEIIQQHYLNQMLEVR